jgi:cell division protein FtsN
MARDYKHRAQPRTKKKQPSCWIWLIAGFLAGALSVGLTWLKLGTDAVGDSQWISDRPTDKPEPHRPVAPPPKFDFYDRLPEREVVVPDEDLPPPASAAPGSPAVSEGPFLIQVASFKKAADADRLKAQLSLLGMTVQVSRVQIDDRDTWHRVRVGPYSTRKALDNARKRLTDNGLRGIVIRSAGG